MLKRVGYDKREYDISNFKQPVKLRKKGAIHDMPNILTNENNVWKSCQFGK